MNMPAVSIIMPTRNRVRLLRRAIESVRAQTMRDWELIIVDDASTDATSSLLREVQACDERVKVMRMDAPVGAAQARNRAIAAGHADLVAFLDDDDEWQPEKLRMQVARMAASPEAGVCCTHFVEIDARGHPRLFGAAAGNGSRLHRRLWRGNVLGFSSSIVRRSALDAINGFDERLPRLQDWDLWLRLSRITDFVIIPVPLVHIYRTPGSISRQTEALEAAVSILLEEATTNESLSRAERADLAHGLGQLLIAGGFTGHGRSLVLDALRYPWPLSRVLIDVLLLLGRRPYLAALRARDSWAGVRAAMRMRGNAA